MRVFSLSIIFNIAGSQLHRDGRGGGGEQRPIFRVRERKGRVRVAHWLIAQLYYTEINIISSSFFSVEQFYSSLL